MSATFFGEASLLYDRCDIVDEGEPAVVSDRDDGEPRCFRIGDSDDADGAALGVTRPSQPIVSSLSWSFTSALEKSGT
jgi:hypothetical protein